MNDSRVLVEAFYRDLWNRHDPRRVPELLSDDFAFRGSLGQERRGHAEFIDYVDFVHAALGDYRCDILDLVSEGDRAFARMRFSGIHRGEFFGHAPTGRRVEWMGAALFTFAGGKIAALWVLGDVHGLLQQLERNAHE
jgi:predicted ester cyclase